MRKFQQVINISNVNNKCGDIKQLWFPAPIQLANQRKYVSKQLPIYVVQYKTSIDIIVKLVSLSPFKVNAGIDLAELNISASEDGSNFLEGDPDNRTTKKWAF